MTLESIVLDAQRCTHERAGLPTTERARSAVSQPLVVGHLLIKLLGREPFQPCSVGAFVDRKVVHASSVAGGIS